MHVLSFEEMGMIRVSALLVMLFLSFGCSETDFLKQQPKQEVPKKADIAETEHLNSEFVVGEMIFGTFYGECFDNCAPMYRFSRRGNANTLWADYDDTYFKKTKSFKTDLNQPEMLKVADDVVHSIPKELLNNMKTQVTYGCPDCGDWGGVYIELNDLDNPNKSKVILLDLQASDSQPEPIYKFAQLVNGKVSELLRLSNTN